MATLRAHGMKLAQVERQGKLSHEGGGTPYRETLALMSDGAILRKVDFYGQYPHSTGWKKARRHLKGLATPETATKWVEGYIAATWTRA